MRRLIELGGLLAGITLVLFGVAAIFIGATGYNEVRDTLRQERIIGTPDSTIPGQLVDTGDEARAFADVMRKHTMAMTGGQTYSEMGRFLDAEGNATNDEAAAAKDANGQPVENGLRQVWVTETALTTALNTAYMAERMALFGIVVGIALLLSGIGFLVLALGGTLRIRAERAEAMAGTPATA
jgi:hypothetical protein